jgi:hypothetical protein
MIYPVNRRIMSHDGQADNPYGMILQYGKLVGETRKGKCFLYPLSITRNPTVMDIRMGHGLTWWWI